MYYYPYMNPYYLPPCRSYPVYWGYPSAYRHAGQRNQFPQANNNIYRAERKDYGKQPFVVNIEEAAEENNTFRTALWTGNHLQVTLMSINAGEDIGLEIHPDVDQFLRIEDGQGFVQMGNSKDNLTFRRYVYEDDAIMVPAGTWHNVVNTGPTPLKLYSIYAPPEHPLDTVHATKADAMAAEHG